MRLSRTFFNRLAAAAALLIFAAGPSLAQSVPCSAFARNTAGGWRVTGPTVLDLNGMLLAPMVGTTFAAGTTTHGIEMSAMLDRACGNSLAR
jgi:hypothetical protein